MAKMEKGNSKSRRSAFCLGTGLVTLLLVGFGQPMWGSLASFLASTVGFALFFWLLMSFDSAKKRFWVATFWFTCVQLIQFSWFLSHPFLYIISVHVLLSLALGLQFGIIGWLVVPERMASYGRIFLIAGCWTLLEWSRLFLLSGLAFNPIGLSMSANIYSLQTASLWGVFGMSYWVMLVNLLALKAWLDWPKYKTVVVWGLAAAFPFIYGAGQLHWMDTDKSKDSFNVVLVQPVFPIEEGMKFHSTESFVQFVMGEWAQIIHLARPHLGKQIDLMALPEFIVPFATYSPVFNYEDVHKIFIDVFGENIKNRLPELAEPLAFENKTAHGTTWYVSNGYWLQAISNIFSTPVVSGMEDLEDFYDGHREYYSAAQYVMPLKEEGQYTPFERYDKRILVPMGEYIPFSFCRDLAASYGITGSFTPGQEAKIFSAKIPFGTSICYEETFGHLMRENRLKGAELLVNLTSDVWYPAIAQQHCDHARLRTVENGIPLVRSCNTGITTAFDSFGREVGVLGETSNDKIWKAGALYVQVPIHSYRTLYSVLGDYFILSIACLGIIAAWIFKPWL